MNSPRKNAATIPINESVKENDNAFSRKLDLNTSSKVVAVNNDNTMIFLLIFPIITGSKPPTSWLKEPDKYKARLAARINPIRQLTISGMKKTATD